MPHGPRFAESQSPAVETFLLGQIPYLRCLELQERLLRQVAQRDDGQIVVLMCEHPDVITIGRGGRPSEVAGSNGVLRSRQIETHWTNRGGGCLVHCPGQLAIYPIVPLRWHDFSVGEYLSAVSVSLGRDADRTGRSGAATTGRYWCLGPNGPDRGFRGGGSRLGYLARGLFERITRDGPLSPSGKRPAGSYADGQCRRRALRSRANGDGSRGTGAASQRCLRLRPIPPLHRASLAKVTSRLEKPYVWQCFLHCGSHLRTISSSED